MARFKADFLNDFVTAHDVLTVLELGCGDGRQLSLAEYPRYVGVDVSSKALDVCRKRFVDDPTKTFLRLDELGANVRAELVISLDVIYHLVEDAVFEAHVRLAFSSATRFVVLYTSDGSPHLGRRRSAPHVRHRPVRAEVARLAPGARLLAHCPNPFSYSPRDEGGTSFADFFVYAADGGSSCA